MNIPRQFRSFDVLVFTFCSTITLGVGFLPYVSHIEVRNAWLQLIVGSLPYFLLLWLIYVFCQKYTDYDFFGALKTHLWKGIYWIVMLYFIGSTLYGAVTLTKGLTIIVETFLLNRTPSWVFQLLFYAVVGLAVSYGIIAITRFVVLFAILEILVLSLIVSFVFSPNFNWIFVPPLWSSDLAPFLQSSFSNAARFGGIVPLLAFISYVKKDEPLWRPMNIGLGLVLFFYASLSIIALGTFGFHQASNLLSPVISLVQSHSTRTGMLERMDLFFLAFWLFAFYKIMMIHVWFSFFLAQKFWKKIKVVHWLIIFLTLTFTLNAFTPGFIHFNLRTHNINVLIYTLTLPILMLVYLIFKKKKKVMQK
jgi:spore germination protein AB